MRYFSHDTNASSDELMIQLRLEHGLEAVAVYWVILETLYSEEKPLVFGENQRETKSVLYRLGLGFEQVKKYVETMVEIGLLISRKSRENNFELISSLRANEHIEAYHVKAEVARQNGKKGGRPKKADSNLSKTDVGFSSVSKKNQSEKLTKTKTKSIGFDKQNLYYASSSAQKSAAALAKTEEAREQHEQLVRQAIPCPEEIKAIFDEVDAC